MSSGIPNEILLGISNIANSGSNATWSLTKTSQGLSFTVTYPDQSGADSSCGSSEYSGDSMYSDHSDEDDSLSILSIDSGYYQREISALNFTLFDLT